MKLSTSSSLALLIFDGVALGQWKCDSRAYGRPSLDHCAGALTSMPDATAQSPTAKLADIRKFVEPQYLEPPFARCHNDLEAPMEQLPKIWRFKSCRFALAPIATSSGQVLNPESVSTWSFIENNAHRLSTRCLARRLGGGVIFIADPRGGGALALYIYAVGAPFEADLNNYMITSRAIHPPNVGLVSNSTSPAATTNGSLQLVWDLQDT